jgi:hypothetical protein
MVAVFVSGMRLYIKTWKNRSKSLRLGIVSFKEYVSLQAHGDSRQLASLFCYASKISLLYVSALISAYIHADFF